MIVEARFLRPRDVIEVNGRCHTVFSIRRRHGGLILNCCDAIGPRGEPRGEWYGGRFGYRKRVERVHRAPRPGGPRWAVAR